MPIAIFRHRKLFIAMHKPSRTRIFNLNSRQILDVLGKNENYNPTVEVIFANLMRNKGLKADVITNWIVSKAGVEVVQAKWFGFRSRRAAPVIYPPLTNIVWTDKNNSEEIFEAFEQGIASQPIVERYLHEHTPNAYCYNIMRIDFPEDGPLKTQIIVPRDMSAVTMAEREDQSDSTEEWLKLLLG